MPVICTDDKKQMELSKIMSFLGSSIVYHLNRKTFDAFADMDYHKAKENECKQELAKVEMEHSLLFVRVKRK